MRILVVGGNGLLGSSVIASALNRGYFVASTHHSTAPNIDVESVSLDIRKTEQFEELCRGIEPDVVVNCAAMTDVDACEHNPEQAEAVNGTAPGRLASTANELGASFVQVSTDYVFDGKTDSRYSIGDTPNPVQVYGQTKLHGEESVRDAHENAIIPRLSFVYGRHAGSGELEGFPGWVRSRLSTGEGVPAFVDQLVTPTRAGQAATTILDLLDVGAFGTMHLACQTCTRPFEIARRVAELSGFESSLVKREQLSDVERVAERPVRTCLDVSRLEAVLGREQPTLEEDLNAVL